MSELRRLRSMLGQSTVLWAGPGGFRPHENGWLALSGVRSVDYNVALCHGPDAQDITRALEELTGARVPAVVMVAGEALANVQVLVHANWVCIGATAFMTLDLRAGEPDAAVRRLTAAELSAARDLVGDAFDVSAELTTVALPDGSVVAEGQSVWGLFEKDELVSCAAFVRVQEATVGWSVSTPQRLRRRGYAERLLRGVQAEHAREGVTLSLVYASAMGEPLYRALGFRELERWQMWSRPRWVLAPG